MGTQKGKLFELAEMYHTYQNKKVKDKQRGKDKKTVEVKGQHFDEGKSISLAYSLDMYPEVLSESYKRHAPAKQMSFWDEGRSEAFYVEPFEAEETIEVPFREASDEEEANLDKVVKGFSAETDDHEDLKLDAEKLGEMEKKLDKVFEPEEEEEATAMAANELKDQEEKKGKNKGAEETTTQPVAGKSDSSTIEKKDKGQPYEVSDEEFARDIGEILKGQKVYDAEQKKAVSRTETNLPQALKPEKSEPAKSAVPKDDVLDPSKNEHKIFEKIAQSMQYANSYDLGAIALEEKFEKMETEIEEEEINKILRSKSSVPEKKVKDIQDVDVIEEEKTQPEAMGIDEKFKPDVPLDNKNGGRLIKEDQLQKGDLILTSSSGGVFDIMEGAQASDSIAGIYTGNNKLLTKGDGGVLVEKPLQPHMTNKGVMVVLRHQNITTEKATSIVDSLTKLRLGPEKNQPENWSKVNSSSISLHPDVCSTASGSDKNKCIAYAGKILLGTVNNDGFLCAESIINIFEKNQLGFVQLLSKEHNGSLKYFGHLKNKA